MGRTILRAYHHSAKIHTRTWAISDNDALSLMAKPCHYCGASPSNVAKGRPDRGSFVYNGIDRVDNTKGYEPSNVVTCCRRCNIGKANGTVGEFHNWVSNVYHKTVEVQDDAPAAHFVG